MQRKGPLPSAYTCYAIEPVARSTKRKRLFCTLSSCFGGWWGLAPAPPVDTNRVTIGKWDNPILATSCKLQRSVGQFALVVEAMPSSSCDAARDVRLAYQERCGACPCAQLAGTEHSTDSALNLSRLAASQARCTQEYSLHTCTEDTCSHVRRVGAQTTAATPAR